MILPVTPSPTNPASPQTPTEKRLLWLIRYLVLQSCSDWPKDSKPAYDDPTPVFSGFVGVHAEAIALLAEYGVVTDLTDNGGRVVGGTLLPPSETAAVLKTGPFDETPEVERDPPSEYDLARYLDAFFKPSPLLKRLRGMHK